MATSRAMISWTLVPGTPITLNAPTDIRLGQVSLDEKLVDQKRSTVKMTYLTPDPEQDEDEEDEEAGSEIGYTERSTIIGSLIPGVVETQLLGGLIVTMGEQVVFQITGKNTVHLVGNVILQEPIDQTPDGSELDEDEYSESDADRDEELDEEIAGMDEDEKEAFLKALSAPEPVPATAVVEETITTTSKKDKSKKKDKSAPTTTTTTTTTTVVAEASKPAETKAAKSKDEKNSKKRKEPEPETEATGEAGKKDKKKAKGADGKAQVPAAKEDGKKTEKKKAAAAPVVTKGGVKIVDKVVGEGPSAKIKNRLSMRYVLKLANGKIVDKNTNGPPFKFHLGAGEVIKGWDEGLVGMKVGGERTLEVPPNMGYGKRSNADIPGNSTLFFEVKLLGIN